MEKGLRAGRERPQSRGCLWCCTHGVASRTGRCANGAHPACPIRAMRLARRFRDAGRFGRRDGIGSACRDRPFIWQHSSITCAH
ncbi:hypothetical protein I35_4140 [Burkholderia cenocepacia H111]|nr:hypothetical protein I35_4140 [Burkholderia cenocepacia H111]